MSRRAGNGAEPVEKKEQEESAERIRELEEYAKKYFEKSVLGNKADGEKTKE